MCAAVNVGKNVGPRKEFEEIKNDRNYEVQERVGKEW